MDNIAINTRSMRKEDLLKILLAKIGVQIWGCLPLAVYTSFARV
jgi:hypothetical protein